MQADDTDTDTDTDTDEEDLELIAVMGLGVWDWEAGAEFLRQRPEEARFASFKGDRTYSIFVSACYHGSPEALSFLQAVRDICPDQFLVRNGDGYLLLGEEGILNFTMPVIRMILEIHIETDFETEDGPKLTEANCNPLTVLSDCYLHDIREAHRLITSREQSPADMMNGGFLEVNLEDAFWEKLTLLTKACHHKSIDDVLPNGRLWRRMHACAGINFFPPHLLRLLTVAFPDGVTEEDENGNLPIHVAALGNFPSIHMTWPTEAFAADMEAFSGTAKSTIAILLEADPTSARRRNRQGKFPLQLAIESGRDWGDGIGTLADAFLAAIGDRDKESGLDLCMLAAAEDCSLTVIYNLFRAKPF
jgi:hypothetical protein